MGAPSTPPAASGLPPGRAAEVEELLGAAAGGAAARDDVVALALVGSWSRGTAGPESDVDLVLLCEHPRRFVKHDAWARELAPGCREIRAPASWGRVTERRVILTSGLEIEVGVGRPSWAAVDPVDSGTRQVVQDGMRILHDPRRLLADLAAACAAPGRGR